MSMVLHFPKNECPFRVAAVSCPPGFLCQSSHKDFTSPALSSPSAQLCRGRKTRVQTSQPVPKQRWPEELDSFSDQHTQREADSGQ